MQRFHSKKPTSSGKTETFEDFQEDRSKMAEITSAINAGKPVFLLMYANWCGHCHHVYPAWFAAGQALASNPEMKNVVFGDVEHSSMNLTKINASLRDKIQGALKGFPTILFLQKGKNPAITLYEGDRSKDALQDWVKDTFSSSSKVMKKGGRKRRTTRRKNKRSRKRQPSRKRHS